MRLRQNRLFTVVLVLALLGPFPAGAYPPRAAPHVPENLFKEQALSNRAVWFLAPAAAAVTIWCIQEWGALPALNLAAASTLVPFREPWAWPGESALKTDHIPQLPATKKAILESGWIGKNAYGARSVSDAYAFLVSPHQELADLINHELERANGSEKRTLTALKTAIPGMSPETLTAEISTHRRAHLGRELEDPEAFQKWAKAYLAIEKILRRIEEKWGKDYRAHLTRMILELEMSLPLLGDNLDNFKEYFLNTDHGLAHSLTVIDLALDLVIQSKEVDTHTHKTKAEMLHEAKRLYAGVGLYHDLTGLRNRTDHHKSAALLTSTVLTPLRTTSGQPTYTHEEISRIAHGCLTHRGQNFDPPVGLLEELFVDADEYLVVVDLLRVFKQAAGGGIFSHKFWDIYRRYIIREDTKFEMKGLFTHETKWADLFQYVFFTLITRTRPENYRTEPARALVRNSYPYFKAAGLQEIEKLIRARGRLLKKTQWEIRAAIRLLHRQITEMEALIKHDEAARQKLIREMGGPDDFTFMLEEYLEQAKPDTRKTYEQARRELELAYHQEGGVEAPRSGRPLLTKPTFRHGLSIFDRYLENPWLNINKALRGKHQSGKSSRYAGFAYGIYLASRDRLKDLWSIVQPDPNVPILWALDSQVAHAIAQYFFNRLIAGRTPNEAAAAAREQLRIFNIQVDEPLVLHERTPFEKKEQEYIRSFPTCNTHVHGSGALTYEEIADICQHYRKHVHLPSAPPGFDPTRAADWRQFGYEDGVTTKEDFERPFKLIKELLANDREFAIHFAWYERIVLKANEEGNHFVAITSTFDAFKDPKRFGKAVKAAVAGIRSAEETIGGRTRGALILGLRKDYTTAEATHQVDLWLNLKRSWERSFRKDAARLMGLDSVGHDAAGFDIQHLRATMNRAPDQWKKAHVGELWERGGLIQTLEWLKEVVEYNHIDQITNPIALFVTLNPNRTDLYSERDQKRIIELQEAVIRALNAHHITIEVSLRSNEHNSLRLRTEEGWSFTPLSVMLQRIPTLVITDDDPGHFDTTYSEEYLLALLGKTVYGSVALPQLHRLLQNSFDLMQRIRTRFPLLEIPDVHPAVRSDLRTPPRLAQSA